MGYGVDVSDSARMRPASSHLDQAFADLVAFARIEVESSDLEPWALVLRALRDGQGAESSLWLVKLYNAYDSLGSAWGVWSRWPLPEVWSAAADGNAAAEFACTQERRGLRGGRVLKHLDSYVAYLAGDPQGEWVRRPLASGDAEVGFIQLLAWLRRVWGVGRQTAFEWAEFLAKVADLPVTAPDAQLWESEGPRRSIQRLYGNESPTLGWLNDKARECRDLLHSEGIDLSWEDFETVICDFNVMRDGRYYPGRHLAALREEIDEIPEPDRSMLVDVFSEVIPSPWNAIAPGIDRDLLAVYRDTGKLVGV